MKLRISKTTGIIYNEDTNNAVGLIGDPNQFQQGVSIAWAEMFELHEANIAAKCGDVILTNRRK